MADWRQIQGRIRRAKSSQDPIAKLIELFDKTRDGMVAFEVGRLYEETAQLEAARAWYSKAAERFRKPAWKKKAEEALARLGGARAGRELDLPYNGDEQAELSLSATETMEASGSETQPVSEPVEEDETGEPSGSAAPGDGAAAPGRKRRRRGRRGGRRRKRGREKGQAPAAKGESRGAFRESGAPRGASITFAPERAPELFDLGRAQPVSMFDEVAAQPASRAGEPALASRTAKLESQLRRLVVSAAHPVGKAEEAPAGPGVLLISDADGVTHYYVEACQTLRIGLGMLLKSGKKSRGEASLRARLAEHLGISESKVSAYLNRHCVVRWLQIDEGAPHLAHFVIAVLRPALNE